MRGDNMKLDISGLDSQIFSAFSETSERRYVYICNMSTNVSRWSKNAVDYFGLPSEYMYDAGHIWEEHIHPDDRAGYHEEIEGIFTGKIFQHSFEYRARNKWGEYVTCTCCGKVIKGENGAPNLFAGTIENHGIMDNVDAVTNLYNIYEFGNRILAGVANKVNAAALIVGVNKFSDINDLYGYDMGNHVLKCIANTFLEAIKYNGYVYRIDGARFAFYVIDKDKEWLEDFYKNLKERVKKSQLLEKHSIAISFSAGAVMCDEEPNVQSIITGLSYAISRSKREKHGELVFFDNEGIDHGKKNLKLLGTLRHSVINGCKGFYLNYQPIIHVEDEQIIGMEALLRWKHEEFGEVSPGVFIPWLENDACFYELGNWIIETALTEAKPIVERYPEFILNVNIAYPQMERFGFIEALDSIIKKVEFPAKNLCIELTERCRTLEQEYLIRQVKGIKDMGIKVALDDFGTGFSSLDVLSYLSVDTLKIDRGFVTGIIQKKANQAIVKCVSQCANDLGVNVCIEGIEDRVLADFLKTYGPGSYQGFFYSKPIGINELIEKYTDIGCKNE